MREECVRLDLVDADVGIDAIEIYVPRNRQRISTTTNTGCDLTGSILHGRWKDAYIEPDALAAFFSSQLARQPEPPHARRAWVACENCATGGDLALDVTRSLVERYPSLRTEVGLLLFCQTTLDEHPTWSTVCRIQYELEFSAATGFLVNQMSSISSMIALKVACEAMLTERDIRASLIIASEKVTPPQRRRSGHSVLGDAASAIVIRRSRPFDYRVLVTLFQRMPTALQPDETTNGRGMAGLAQACTGIIRDALAFARVPDRHHVLVLLPNLNRPVVRTLVRSVNGMGIRTHAARIFHAGCLGSSDFAVGLAQAREYSLIESGDIVLALGLANNFALACTVLRYEPR